MYWVAGQWDKPSTLLGIQGPKNVEANMPELAETFLAFGFMGEWLWDSDRLPYVVDFGFPRAVGFNLTYRRAPLLTTWMLLNFGINMVNTKDFDS